MTITASVCIDVPSLAQGVAFYYGAFGFSKKSEPMPGVAVLHGLNIELCLLEKPARPFRIFRVSRALLAIDSRTSYFPRVVARRTF